MSACNEGPTPTLRPFRQAQGPSIFLGVLRSGVSLSNPEALEGQAQGGEEDRTTMLRVIVSGVEP